MKTKIRLKKCGKKKFPYYRIVVASANVTRDGKEIEQIGHYNPMTSKGLIRHDRLEEWVSHGSQINPSVKKLLNRGSLSYNS